MGAGPATGHRARARARDRRGHCRIRARPDRRMPHPGLALCRGAHPERSQFRPAHRSHLRVDHLRALCRIDDRPRAVDRRGGRAVLARLRVDPHGGRDLSRRPVPRGQPPVPETRGRERRPASRLGDLCAARLRISVRLRRPPSRGAACGNHRRACPVRPAAVSRKLALYRDTGGLDAMAALPGPRQLVLALDHAESFARDDFLPGPSNEAGLALVGPEGSGKSHLAAIWAALSGARILSARLLDEADVPRALTTGAVVIEDLAADGIDERALFHLLNLAREQEASVLLTARSAPAGHAFRIADLASRLRAVPVVALTPPDETLLRALIVKLAADRQLLVDEALVSFLVTRIERSYAAARAAVALIDREAMRLKRPPTRALAAELWRDRA